MQYSSITQKMCKCGKDKCFPTISYEGWNVGCAPQEVLDRLDKRQKRKNANKKVVSKLRNEQYAEGNYEEAERAYLIKDLDFVFSRLVRMSAADRHGRCDCYTCGDRKHWSLQQLGHFIKRGNTEIRWLLQNGRVQCKYCNENLDGNLEVYEQKLNAEHEGLPEQLRERAREPYKWTRDELKQLLIDLRAKLRIIETKFKT